MAYGELHLQPATVYLTTGTHVKCTTPGLSVLDLNPMLFRRLGSAWLQNDSREADTLKRWPLLLFVSLSLPAIGQSSAGTSQDKQAGHLPSYTSLEQEPDDLRQELDADAAALSKIPADPLLQPDPLGAGSGDVDQGFSVKAIRVPAIPIKVGAQRRWRD